MLPTDCLLKKLLSPPVTVATPRPPCGALGISDGERLTLENYKPLCEKSGHVLFYSVFCVVAINAFNGYSCYAERTKLYVCLKSPIFLGWMKVVHKQKESAEKEGATCTV